MYLVCHSCGEKKHIDDGWIIFHKKKNEIEAICPQCNYKSIYSPKWLGNMYNNNNSSNNNR